jgi:hypothetical protein
LRNEFDHEDALRTPAPNFKIGLGHVLSGILAHLSSTVLSATMAWHLVVKDSRFQFSHNFSQILLSQLESWLLSTNQKENMESDFEEIFFIGLATIILGMILHVWKSYRYVRF